MEISVTHRRLHHIFRVGACPVLEVTVTYPCLGADLPEDALSPAITRFDQAYLRMAEGVLNWCAGEPLAEAEAAFRAGGAGAGFRFDRRFVTCEMTVTPGGPEEQKDATLQVCRTLRMGSRRGEILETTRTGKDVWRIPELTLCRQPKFFKKQHLLL